METSPDTVAGWLANASQGLLALPGHDGPLARLEARLLLGQVLGVDRAWLVAHDRDPLPDSARGEADALLARRLAGEPMAYILGEREFFGRRFRVSPATLIPRPETEHLVESALARLPAGPAKALDIGTGSGCIAITLKLERPDLEMTAVDLSSAALAVARDNATRLDAALHFAQSDLFSALDGRSFDLIVSNPPYIAAADAHLSQGDLRFEPRDALASGADGLQALRGIIGTAPGFLHPGGWLVLEHGWDQAAAVEALLAQAGFASCFLLRDLAGQARVSGGRYLD